MELKTVISVLLVGFLLPLKSSFKGSNETRKRYCFLINKNDTLIKKIIFDEKHIGYKIIDEKRKDKYFATNHSYANYDYGIDYKDTIINKDFLKNLEGTIIKERRIFIDKYAKKDEYKPSGKEHLFIVQEGDKFILMTAHPSNHPKE